ncbi:OsmC family protein [Candidiatus Paracoxiella cheracis]|uniref:OsmC family protein n=1 Tax=Candidiatus Paracoxiella cheracis TaxID=3405120 RepID=UPI003BF49412
MSEHRVTVTWSRESEDFSYKNYNRSHEWDFGHGVTVKASAAPDYQGDPELIDPEQGFVAALSSCHMLTFLAIASQKRFVIDHYEDKATGVLAKNAEGKIALTEVTLRPKVTFSGESHPDEEALAQLHEAAHKNCFLANSVTTLIKIE